MKLLFCKSCWDALRLQTQVRSCRCGSSRGRLNEDGHTAEVRGRNAEVVGVEDRGMIHALKNPDLDATVFGVGPEVKCWLYPHTYEKITRAT